MTRRERLDDEQGAALVTTMLIIMIASLLLVVSNQLAVHSAQAVGYVRSRVAGVHAAEAGVDWAVQQMTTSTGASCTWAATPPSLPTSTGSGQPAFTVSVTDSNPVGGCGDSATDLRRTVVATGRDSATGPTRRVQAEVQLVPNYTSSTGYAAFTDAVFAGSTVTPLAAAGYTLRGEGGDNAGVYTAYTGNAATISGATDIRGSYTAGGRVAMSNTAQIRGDLWANGNVTLTNTAIVRGNIIARGTVTVASTSHVYGTIRASGAITAPAGTVDGTKTQNDAATPTPTARTLPTPPLDYSTTSWPKPYRTFATCQNLTTWFADPTNQATVKGTYFVQQASCSVLPFVAGQTLGLTGTAAIVATGCIESTATSNVSRPSGSAYELWLISLKTAATACSLGSADNLGVKLVGASWLSTVPTFVYAGYQAEVTGTATMNGQLFAATVKLASTFSLDLHRTPVPGFGGGAAVQDGYTAKVLYVRQMA
jgi:Tfp pilus assembly protein PilX/cytoskeletal protein CcmA (bactofilin family)